MRGFTDKIEEIVCVTTDYSIRLDLSLIFPSQNITELEELEKNEERIIDR